MQTSLFERQVSSFSKMRPLRPRQLQAIRAIRDAIREGHKRIILQAPTGFGKCHGRGTKVVMYDGTLRRVEEVRPGDKLMGPDSKPRTVLNAVCGNGPLYLVRPIKGRPFVCNDVHVLSLKRTRFWHKNGGGNKGKWYGGEIVNLPLVEYLDQSRNFKAQHKLWRVGIEMPHRELPIHPYAMGMLLGDGSLMGQVNVTTMDPEVVEEVYSLARGLGLTVRVKAQPGNRSSVYFFRGDGKHNRLVDTLRSLGVYGCGANSKRIPRPYKTADRRQRLELLAGLIDTDGHVYKNGQNIEYSTKSRLLMRDVEFLCRSLGFGFSVSVKIVDGEPYYQASIHGDYRCIPTRVARKKVTSARKQKKNVLVSGFKVEPIGEGEYYGFALDGDHLYLLEDFTVTHNTLTSAHIIAGALRKCSKPLFTCPAISLVDQTLASFEAEGIQDIGVIQASHPRTNPNASLQIATPQTLVRRQAPDSDFALIDEVHETFDGLDAMLVSEQWKNRIAIGLSATPWTKGLGLLWTKLVIAATINDLIAEGHATPARIYGPEREIDRGALHVSKGDFEEAGAAAAMSDASIVGDVLKEWKDKSPREKTFAFCVNRDHARAQMEAFHDAGIPFGYIDAFVDRDSRKRIFAQMRYGEIAGIASVGCLIRGVDEDVRCILDLQPTRSEIRHVQKWGRGVRTAAGKDVLIGLDHAGNNASLGLFTDIYHDHLDTRKPSERGEAYQEDYKPAKPRKCPKCHLVLPPRARTCPFCHEKLPLHSGVTVVNGRLVEIGSGPKVDVKERQAWYSGFLWMAKRNGMKDGWAAYRYRDKFGMWPQGLRVQPRKPSSRYIDAMREFTKEQRKQYLASRTEDAGRVA